MLAPSRATSWKTTYRFTLSRSDSAHGRGELSMGRSADPGRIAEARNRRFGTHRLALSARPPDYSVKPGVHSSRTTSVTRHLSRR
jgi:hypothetical protein